MAVLTVLLLALVLASASAQRCTVSEPDNKLGCALCVEDPLCSKPPCRRVCRPGTDAGTVAAYPMLEVSGATTLREVVHSNDFHVVGNGGASIGNGVQCTGAKASGFKAESAGELPFVLSRAAQEAFSIEMWITPNVEANGDPVRLFSWVADVGSPLSVSSQNLLIGYGASSLPFNPALHTRIRSSESQVEVANFPDAFVGFGVPVHVVVVMEQFESDFTVRAYVNGHDVGMVSKGIPPDVEWNSPAHLSLCFEAGVDGDDAVREFSGTIHGLVVHQGKLDTTTIQQLAAQMPGVGCDCAAVYDDGPSPLNLTFWVIVLAGAGIAAVAAAALVARRGSTPVATGSSSPKSPFASTPSGATSPGETHSVASPTAGNPRRGQRKRSRATSAPSRVDRSSLKTDQTPYHDLTPSFDALPIREFTGEPHRQSQRSIQSEQAPFFD